jgi:DNA polymerase-4
MDAFYVSVELQRRPELRGRPVVVAGSGPRAVVTTASYEARRYGIFSATPAAWARRRCPDAVFVTPDFDLYRARSREVMAVLRDEFESVEVVGLDEAYADLTGLGRPRSAARRAKAAIVSGTGLGCSIGLGPSKLVAKVASDAEKPDGFVTLTRAQACERFAGATPGLIPGIGPRSVERLAAAGIKTLGALAQTPADDLARLLGPGLGPAVGRLARFEDDRPVTADRVAKSESRETTFDADLTSLPELERVLLRLVSELCASLQRRERRGRTVGIKVRTADFETHTRARTLPAATAEADVVGRVAVGLLRALAPSRPIRLVGVRVASLEAPQVSLAAAAGADAGQLALGL